MNKTAKNIFLYLLFSCGMWSLAAPGYAIPKHPHGDKPTTWELDGNEGDFEVHNHTGVTTEAGDSPHQHYNSLSFGGWNNMRDPWSAYGAWDDEVFYLDTTDPFDSPYPPVPHGFIDEFAADNTPDDRTMQGKKDRIPDYFFVDPDNWDQNAIDIVDVAFSRWSALQAGKSPVSGLPLLTGLEFERTLVRENAEILLVWQDIADLGETTWNNVGANVEGDTTVTFDSNPGMGGWYFPIDHTTTPANQFHFFSTALHEVGHVVGLEEQNDTDDVMIFQRGPGPNGPAFSVLDDDSKEGAYALYSIPKVPEPTSTLSLLVLGTFGATSTLKRKLKPSESTEKETEKVS